MSMALNYTNRKEIKRILEIVLLKRKNSERRIRNCDKIVILRVLSLLIFMVSG